MPFQIIRNDITKVAADAIVNTANPRPVIGGGTDSAIYKAAGENELLAERKKIGDIAPGDAKVTPAFGLHAKYIIHTVGPVWIDGEHNERETLHSCYAKSLNLAAELECESIAFPLIATGVYGFPKEEALDIAMEEIGKFLLTHEMQVTLVVFDRKAFKLSSKLMGEIDAYIDEHTVGRLRRKEYEIDQISERMSNFDEEERYDRRERRRLPNFHIGGAQQEKKSVSIPEDIDFACASAAPVMAPQESVSLHDYLDKKEDTFQQRLFKLIDASGRNDVQVYKDANVDRKVFSKIKSNVNYKPAKRTAVAFGIALHLNMT